MWQLAAIVALCLTSASAQTWGSRLWGDTINWPWEECALDPDTGRYTAYVNRYYQDPAAMGAWTMCFKLVVLGRESCYKRSGYMAADGTVQKMNETRCCDANMNKLKLWVRSGCRGSIMHYTVGNATSWRKSSAYTFEEMGPGKKNLIVKFTPLALTPDTADGTEVCIRLKAPCATMAQFSPNGDSLRFALYDKKAITGGRHYECCPEGVVPVERVTLEDENTPVYIASPPPNRSPPPPPKAKPPPPPRKAKPPPKPPRKWGVKPPSPLPPV